MIWNAAIRREVVSVAGDGMVAPGAKPRACVGRYEELDSLRGLAALAVVAHHCLLVFPAVARDTHAGPPSLLAVFKYSPLHIAWAGREAVFLFFVLSGFVLALPILEARGVGYTTYLVRRIARIYPPYLVAVLLAFAACTTLSRDGIASLSDWFNSTWRAPFRTRSLVSHVLLLPSFDNAQFDPVLWSLVQEMRISLVFPFIALLVARTSWLVSLSVGVLVDALTIALEHVPTVAARRDDYLLTGHFFVLFVVGALLARYRAPIVARYQALPSVLRALLVGTGVVLYTWAWIGVGVRWLHVGPMDRYATGLGAAIFLVAALGSTRGVRLLLHAAPMRFVGRISYSLYLFHAVVLFTVVHVFYGAAPLPLLLASVVVVSVVAATLATRFVEAPSIALGRRLARALGARQSERHWSTSHTAS
jgi:peptidoglycan/LPS O-acetylase OafA/YrhL